MMNFKPGATATLPVTATSANVQVIDSPPGDIRIYNAGPNTAFLNFGVDNTVTATTGHYPVPAGVVEMIRYTNKTRFIAAIAAGSGTATVYLTGGEGS